MISTTTSIALLALALAPLPGGAQEDRPEARPDLGGDGTISAEITAAELRGHVQALSSDLLRGRPMGSPESMRAAEHCAAALAAMGLAPGAADGTYFQRIPFGRALFEGVPELVCTLDDGTERTLRNGEEFTFQSAALAEDTGPLRCVFVAEESDVPAEADAGVALVFGTSALKANRWLEDAGHHRGAGFGAVVVPRRGRAGEPEVPRSGPMRPLTSDRGTLKLSILGDAEALASAGRLASIRFVSHAAIERQDDANVVAVLPGTDGHPRGKEVVVLSAHRDHIGTLRLRDGQPAPEDVVNNGADDDASGCATVMEIAEAVAQAPGEGPRRTLVVILVTGEEAGMVGSQFWVKDPTVDLERVVCALNFEMLGRPDPMVGGAGHIWLTGDDRSDLGPHLRDETGLDVSADPRLEMNFFVRSDNVSFARAGIVSQTLSSFGGHGDYHRVTDEWDTLDYAHMETAARACLAAVRELLGAEWTPSWNEGEPRF